MFLDITWECPQCGERNLTSCESGQRANFVEGIYPCYCSCGYEYIAMAENSEIKIAKSVKKAP